MTARRLVAGWSVVVFYLALLTAVFAAVRVWSSRERWGGSHVLAWREERCSPTRGTRSSRSRSWARGGPLT